MLSTWAVEDLFRYRAGRFPVRTYLPLAVFLCAAALAGAAPVSAAGLALRLALASGLLFQFRLWDDLADVERDRRDHPERVLARLASLAPFRLLLLAAFLGNAALVALLDPRLTLGVFVLLSAAFLAWYRGLRRLAGPITDYHVILCKYPCFVHLLRGSGEPPDRPLLCVLALVYLCFCVHEVLHDRRLWAVRGSAAFLLMEMAAMPAAALLLAGEVPKQPRVAVLRAVLAVLGGALLIFLFRRFRKGLAPGSWPGAVFVVAFAWLVAASGPLACFMAEGGP